DARVHGAGTAVREHDAVARIVALLNGRLADQIGHLMLDHPRRTGCSLDQAHAELGRDRLQALPRAFGVELQTTPEKIVGVDVAEREVRVRDRRLGAAAAVAGGTWLGSGRERSHAQAAAPLVDPDHGAAAAADRADVDPGHEVLVLVDHALVARHRLAIPD